VFAAAGTLLWIAWSGVQTHAPTFVRFVVAWTFFVAGPGAAAACILTTRADMLERWVLPAAAGIVASPLLANALLVIGAERAFPLIAAALGGAGLERIISSPPAPRPPRRTWVAFALVSAVALGAGAVAYAHRLEVTSDAVNVFGDYDAYDSSYYAAMSAELTHHFPPQSPFYAGHALNYSWYPQLLLALIHRYGDVALLDTYFVYAWPFFLVALAMMAFVAVRRMAGTPVATLATLLLVLGSDFSYLAAIFFRRLRAWDDLVWSTNWMTPGAELLYYNPWTPALVVAFLALWSMARHEETGGRALLAASCISVGTLMMFKPFGFALIVGGLLAAAIFSRDDVAARRRFLVVCAGGTAIALPFVVNAFLLRADSQSTLVLGSGYGGVLPVIVTRQLGLSQPLERLIDALGGGQFVAALMPIVVANVLFFAGGLGVRVLALPAVWRGLRSAPAERPIWRLLGWIVVIGAVTPLAIVTNPYHQSFMFYQGSLFVLWIFVARTVVGDASHPSSRRLLAAAIVVALAAPSTVHYLHVKWTDSRHPFWTFTRDGLAVVNALRHQDVDSTVVAHRFPGGASIFPVLSERHVLLAWSAYARGVQARVLEAEMDDFFHDVTADPRKSWSMLRRNHVTHVIEITGDHINPQILERLSPLLVTPMYRLLAVPPETGCAAESDCR
jgi:hypothetical protein